MKHDVIVLLDAMEYELKQVNAWEAAPPSVNSLSSTAPFCMDTLQMTQWLQWVFIPRVHAILEHKGKLPVGANMKPYAEEAFAVDNVHSEKLLALIGQFDQLMN